MAHTAQPYKNVLDVACDDAKFRKYFATANYTGIDVSLKSITSDRAILVMKKFQNTKLLVGDLTNPNFIAINGKFDLVVCTHTMAHIKNTINKEIAARNLINSINNNGSLIVQLTDNCLKMIKPILDDNLILKKHVRYRGLLSNYLEKNYSIKFHSSYVGRKVNLLLSFIDFGKYTDNLLLYKK
jgi:2-polyprenyl-3-methyl-5-hydroxy-6-metoxy-1,4-benzoquinol methylase